MVTIDHCGETGMIFMIKLHGYLMLSLVLISSGCSVFNNPLVYKEVPGLIKTAVIGGKDYQITPEFYENFEFSFATFELGRAGSIVAVLEGVDRGILKWVTANDEHIYTYNGKIIKTNNVIFNINTFNYREFQFIPLNSIAFDIELYDPYKFVTSYTKLHEPKLKQVYRSHLERFIDTDFYTEAFDIKEIGFKGSNKYWVSKENGRVVKTEQRIHPYFKKITIEFYYK